MGVADPITQPLPVDRPIGRFRDAVAEPRARGWGLDRAWVVVAAATACALVVRLLLVRGIWVDEAVSIHQAHMSLGGMLHNLRATDNHPPLYFLLLWATVRLLGYGQLAVHVPTIAAGTLLVPAIYITGRELFDRRTGMLAAALSAIAPLLVWYSQEARPYALFMLFATLAVWAQMRIIRDGRIRYWVLYAALTVALLYTHYFSVLPIAIQQLAFAAWIWRRSARGEPVAGLIARYWLTWLAIAVAVAPLVPYVHQQYLNDVAIGQGIGGAPSAGSFTTGAPLTGHPSVYALIANFVWAIWGYHANSTMLAVGALWPLSMLLALALLGRGRSPSATLALALALVPGLVLLGVGFADRTLFEVRYFAGAIPMLILLCAHGTATSSSRRLPVTLVALGLGVTLLVGLADQQLSSGNPRDYDFRAALRTVHAQSRPGDTLLYAPDYLIDVIDYYAPGIRAELVGQQAPSVPAHGRVFLLASFLDQQRWAARVGKARWTLDHSRLHLVAVRHLEKIDLWEYR